MYAFDTPAPQKILSVSELNRIARELLETQFPLFWIKGELSNFTRAASGHWYFSLKDEKAQVRCVMFKGRNTLTGFLPREGDHLEARATVSLYEARGDFQLTIEFMQKAGLGALYEAYEQLKNRLMQAGLLDANRKKPLPAYPETMGIVTSPDAAALRDVLTTLKRRQPAIRIILYPTPVQGKTAAASIATAIRTAAQRNEVDTLIVCRGGGSMEDLWSFNDEAVAYAIADCPIPVISGVGHETDFTLCDLVADVRAATPTAAAELACPDQYKMIQQLEQYSRQLQRQFQWAIEQRTQHLDYLSRRLISPIQSLRNRETQISLIQSRLTQAGRRVLELNRHRLERLQNSLTQLNPKNVLARGYAYVQDEHQEVVLSTKQLSHAQQVKITLMDGEALAEITDLNPKDIS